MHKEVLEFLESVKKRFPSLFFKKRVLELGSLDWNGTPRHLFDDCEYIGIDVINGSGVDVVCSASTFFSEEKFDVIITTEMLEHDKDWATSLSNAVSLLKKGGVLIGTAANINREPHCLELGHYRNISRHDLMSVLGTRIEIKEDVEKNDIRFIYIKE
jgi:SAM-dependent methyltransferase